MELDGYGGTSFVHLECHKSLGNLWDSRMVSNRKPLILFNNINIQLNGMYFYNIHFN